MCWKLLDVFYLLRPRHTLSLSLAFADFCWFLFIFIYVIVYQKEPSTISRMCFRKGIPEMDRLGVRVNLIHSLDTFRLFIRRHLLRLCQRATDPALRYSSSSTWQITDDLFALLILYSGILFSNIFISIFYRGGGWCRFSRYRGTTPLGVCTMSTGRRQSRDFWRTSQREISLDCCVYIF